MLHIKIMCKFEIPKTITTDQGSMFVGRKAFKYAQSLEGLNC